MSNKEQLKDYERWLRNEEKSQATIANTGIRVSELSYIIVDTVWQGEAVVNCKNKIRHIFIPKKLCRELKQYI